MSAVIIHKQQISADKRRVFREWWQCSSCLRSIGHDDVFCSYCGVQFKGVKLETL